MNEPQYDQKLFSEFFDWQPQAFVWLEPVWNEEKNTIIDFLYIYSNDIGLDYLKLTRDMLNNIRISTTPSLTDNMRPVILNEMIQVYNTGQTASTEIYNPIINKFGKVFRIRFRGGILTTIQDKTEEKQAILQLSEKTKELQRSNVSLEEFAYAASHDLQEPLRKITAFSDKLKQELGDQLTDTQQNIFNRLQSSAVRMKGLIEDLLAYSRVSIKQENLLQVDLNIVVDDVLQDLERVINEAGVKITIDKLPKITADARQMRQMFQNIIGNAIKYRKPGMTAEVTITCQQFTAADPEIASFPIKENGTYYLINITDNGIGFEQQYAEKIFQVFQRLHGRAEYEGTGIGLAIVQKVVNNHKGFIKAISSPGNGASFQVLFPAIKSN